MKTLNIAKDLSLPLDFVTQTVAVLAKRRSGKSYTMRRIAEQLLEAQQQIVIVDPKGDQWGIRSSADGKKAGYPITILGGEHGDIPLEVGAGELVAKLVVEEQVSILLDLSSFRKHEVATFMTAFMENLYRLKAKEAHRTPVMFIVDEADAIAPQKPQKGEERMLGAIEDIVRRGGQRGIGCLLITQRSAVLNKNVLTQAQMLIVLRTIAPQDLAAMRAWVDVHGTDEEGKLMMESLPALPIGDAYFWSPGWPTVEGVFQRSHVLPITTFDSGATPKPGERKIVPKKLADVDLATLQKQMAATIEKAKAEDPKLLRKRIAELEKQHAPAITVRPMKEELAAALEPHLTALASEREGWKQRIDEWDEYVNEIMTIVNDMTQSLRAKQKRPAKNPAGLYSAKVPEVHKTPAVTVVRHAQPMPVSTDKEFEITKPMQKVLDAVGWLNSVGIQKPVKEAVAAVSGYRPTSGGYMNLLGKLRAAGYIEYPEPGVIVLSSVGRSAVVMDHGDRPPVIEQVYGVLSGPEARVLRAAASVYPEAIIHEELAASAGYEPTSGGFMNLKGKLRTLGFITYPSPGMVRAADILFP